MNQTIFFSICSIFYCFLLLSFLFSKKNKKNVEIKNLKILAIINLLTLFCEASGSFLGANYEKYELINSIVLKSMIGLYAAWFSMFMVFINNIAKKNKTLDIKSNLIYYVMLLISVIVVLALPIVYNTNKAGAIIYTSGACVEVLRVYTLLCEGICLLLMFKNIKNIKASRYASLFVLVSVCTLSAVIQTYYPSVLLVASTETLVMYVAYINNRENKIRQLETKGNE